MAGSDPVTVKVDRRELRTHQTRPSRAPGQNLGKRNAQQPRTLHGRERERGCVSLQGARTDPVNV